MPLKNKMNFPLRGVAERVPSKLRHHDEPKSGRTSTKRSGSGQSLVLATLGALTLLFASPGLQARDEVPSPGTPFATIPSHLKTLTTSEQKAIRPLLIFQMAAAGSFADSDTVTVNGKKVRKARFYIVRDIMDKYVNEYGNAFQWALYMSTEGLQLPHMKQCGNRDGYCEIPAIDKMFDFYQQRYGGDQWALRNYSHVKLSENSIRAGSLISNGNWGDAGAFDRKMKSTFLNKNREFRPFSIDYVVQAPYYFRHNVRYRCQPAYFVVVDDGKQQRASNGYMNGSENAIYGMFELARYGDNPYPWKKLQIKKFKDYTRPVRGLFKNVKDYDVMSYDYACMTMFSQNSTNGAWLTTPQPTDGSCGMRIFSETLARTDMMKVDELRQAGKSTVDAAGKSWDDPDFPMQTLNTFSIRVNNEWAGDFGSYSSPWNNAQSYFRMKGIASQDSYFYDVKDGDQLREAFDSIISEVKKSISYGKIKAYSTVSPALGAPEMTPVPGSAANIRLNMFDGSSEIRFHEVSFELDQDKLKKNQDENPKADLDEAAAYSIEVDLKKYTLPEFRERTPLFEYNGKSYLMGDLNRTGLDNESFHIPDSLFNAKPEWRDGLLKWITRTRPDEDIENERDFLLSYRVRVKDTKFDNYSMGDIIDTPVLDIGDYMTTAANDGMVYVFKKTANGGEDFSLKMNYLPMDTVRENLGDMLYKHYHLLPHPEYSQSVERPHQYMINGGMTWRLTAESPKESRNLIVAGSFGQGGRGAYAIRIAGNELAGDGPVGIESNQNVWDRAVPLFTVNADSHPGLGYTFGDPQIGQVSNNRQTVKVPGSPGVTGEKSVTKFTSDEYRYAMFLSSGFNNPAKGIDKTQSALYVFNVFDRTFGGDTARLTEAPGTLLKTIVADVEGGGLAQSTLVDLDNDGIVDLAYAGDYNGTIYRFDFRNGIDRAFAVPIFKAPFGQRFTSAPGIMKVTKKDPDSKRTVETGEIMVVIGTGSDIYESDSKDKGQNSIYGIRDNPDNANPVLLNTSKLRAQSFHEGSPSADKRGIEVKTRVGTSNELRDAPGWYVNLSEGTGERVVTKPVMYDGMALFATRIYDTTTQSTTINQNPGLDDPCVAKESTQTFTGSGWIMQFDAMTGAKPEEFDFDSDEKQMAYIDFMGHLDDSSKPIVSGVMEPGAGIPNLTMSGDKPVAQGIQIMKGVDFKKQLQMDANFEGDIGGSGVSGVIRKLSELTPTDTRNYNLLDMKYERKKIVPALFISTSIKGLQDPYTLAIKKIRKPKQPEAPASQTQILKRISFRVLD